MTEKKQTKEIDIIGLLKRILAEWKQLGAFVGVFAVIGVVVALNTPKRYTANVILAPELSSGSSLSGGLSNIASMMGVNLGSMQGGMDAIYPQIYPDVLTSSDFILQLFDVKVRQQEDTTEKTYYSHLIEDGKAPFWAYPGIWLSQLFKSDDDEGKGGGGLNPFNLSKQQDGVLNAIYHEMGMGRPAQGIAFTLPVSDVAGLVKEEAQAGAEN